MCRLLWRYWNEMNKHHCFSCYLYLHIFVITIKPTLLSLPKHGDINMKLSPKFSLYNVMWKNMISYTLSREYRVMKIDIHGCYSPVKIAFAPICACMNNRRIWRHHAITSRLLDVTDQLWWRHNAKSEKTVLGEMSDRWLFLAELCSGHRIASN